MIEILIIVLLYNYDLLYYIIQYIEINMKEQNEI